MVKSISGCDPLVRIKIQHLVNKVDSIVRNDVLVVLVNKLM
jgi:hypothetical protein